MGSAGIAAWIALIAFPALLMIGWARDDIGLRAVIVFALLGLAVWFGLPRLVGGAGDFRTPALAVLDIALVFAVFKGDVRIG